MKRFFFASGIISVVILTSVIYSGCSGVNEAVKNAQRLKFKLGNVDNLSIAGVKLNNVSSIGDINVIDGAKLLAAFAGGDMTAKFNVNLIAKNPDSPGGSKESSSLIKALDWRLLIDDKEMLSGEIDHEITIPGVGKQVTIPIPVKIDLQKMFGDGGYEKLMNLALAIGGKNGSSSRLTLKIQPTIDTFLGGITYPGEIDVINKEFR